MANEFSHRMFNHINAHIELNDLIKIFSCSSRLTRLIIKKTFSGLDIDSIEGYILPQLKSLIIEEVNSTIDEMESFLLLTPCYDLVGHKEKEEDVLSSITVVRLPG